MRLAALVLFLSAFATVAVAQMALPDTGIIGDNNLDDLVGADPCAGLGLAGDVPVGKFVLNRHGTKSILGSGALVADNRTVATAAHLFFAPTSAEATPAVQPSDRLSFAIFERDMRGRCRLREHAVAYSTFYTETPGTEQNHDFAVIRLANPVEGRVPLGLPSEIELDRIRSAVSEGHQPIRIWGYAQHQSTGYGTFLSMTECSKTGAGRPPFAPSEGISHDCDSYFGMSGGPVTLAEDQTGGPSPNYLGLQVQAMDLRLQGRSAADNYNVALWLTAEMSAMIGCVAAGRIDCDAAWDGETRIAIAFDLKGRVVASQ